MAGRSAQDPGTLRGGLLAFLGGSQLDRLGLGGVEVIDGEVEVKLLGSLGRPPLPLQDVLAASYGHHGADGAR